MPASFKINDIEYSTPRGWEEIKFSKFLQYLDEIQPQRPFCLDEFLKEHFEALEELDKNITPEERDIVAVEIFQERWENLKAQDIVICLNFFAVDVGFWCDIEPQLIREAMNLDELIATFWMLQLEMNPSKAKVNENFVGFEVDGVEYLLPKKHMTESTVLEFSESAQFQTEMQGVEGGDFRAMANVMTVLCRPKDEPYSYNEMKHARRRKIFLSTTMDNVINTAFFLLKLNETLRDNLLIYTLMEEKKALKLESFKTDTGGPL